ncbi:MAG: methyltransferase domain-containing protein [Arenicella sp.]|nr:methyltransferase domain-containing protein [Arenicella sp.]
MKNNFEIVNEIHSSGDVIRWLDAADGLDFIQKCKEKMQSMCSIKKGDNVLDVGCGLGQEVEKFAGLVGTNGQVIGVDLSAEVIAEARVRLSDKGLPVEFLTGSADKLNFPDNRFDLVRAERVLEYMSDPLGMVSEMVRVTRPGGEVLIFDFDYSGTVIDTSMTELAGKVNSLMEQSVPNPRAGGSIFRHFRNADLIDIQVEPQMFPVSYFVYKAMVDGGMKVGLRTGVISQLEYDKWWKELEGANQRGCFFAVFSGLIVKGIKMADTN